MKVRFVGDPRYRDNPAKAADPDRIVYHGKEFPKGEWVTLDDKEKGADKAWAEKHGDRLRGNAHFEVDNEPAAPGMEKYEDNKDWEKKREEERKAQEEQDKREADIPGHAPDRGPVKDIGQENPGGPPTAGIEGNPMTRGLSSVDSPTDTPSRNPNKRENLLREREAAVVEKQETPVKKKETTVEKKESSAATGRSTGTSTSTWKK